MLAQYPVHGVAGRFGEVGKEGDVGTEGRQEGSGNGLKTDVLEGTEDALVIREYMPIGA